MQNLIRKEDSLAVMQHAYSYTLLNGTDSLLLYPESGNPPNDKILKVDNGNNNNNTISSSTDVTMANEADSPPTLHTLKNMSQSQEIHLMAGDRKQIINIKDFPLNLTGPVALRIKPVTDKVGESTLEANSFLFLFLKINEKNVTKLETIFPIQKSLLKCILIFLSGCKNCAIAGCKTVYIFRSQVAFGPAKGDEDSKSLALSRRGEIHLVFFH